MNNELMPLLKIAGYLLLIPASQYILGPILIRFINKMRIEPAFEKFDSEKDIPDVVGRLFNDVETKVVPLGFHPPTRIFVENLSGNGDRAYLLQSHHPKELSRLSVIAQYTKTAPENSPSALIVSFSTTYLDESAVGTSNGRTPPVKPRKASERYFRFKTDDALELYALHVLITREIAGAKSRKAPPEDPIVEQQQQHQQELKAFADVGYMCPGSDEFYRTTWKGACLMTWRFCWPIRQITMSGLRNNTREFLKAIELPPELEAIEPV